jgi:hypothetical protein
MIRPTSPSPLSRTPDSVINTLNPDELKKFTVNIGGGRILSDDSSLLLVKLFSSFRECLSNARTVDALLDLIKSHPGCDLYIVELATSVIVSNRSISLSNYSHLAVNHCMNIIIEHLVKSIIVQIVEHQVPHPNPLSSTNVKIGVREIFSMIYNNPSMLQMFHKELPPKSLVIFVNKLSNTDPYFNVYASRGRGLTKAQIESLLKLHTMNCSHQSVVFESLYSALEFVSQELRIADSLYYNNLMSLFPNTCIDNHPQKVGRSSELRVRFESGLLILIGRRLTQIVNPKTRRITYQDLLDAILNNPDFAILRDLMSLGTYGIPPPKTPSLRGDVLRGAIPRSPQSPSKVSHSKMLQIPPNIAYTNFINDPRTVNDELLQSRSHVGNLEIHQSPPTVNHFEITVSPPRAQDFKTPQPSLRSAKLEGTDVLRIAKNIQSPPRVQNFKMPQSPPRVQHFKTPQSPPRVQNFKAPQSPPRVNNFKAPQSPPKVNNFKAPQSPPRVNNFKAPQSPPRVQNFKTPQSPPRVNNFKAPQSPPRVQNFKTPQSPPRVNNFKAPQSPPRVQQFKAPQSSPRVNNFKAHQSPPRVSNFKDPQSPPRVNDVKIPQPSLRGAKLEGTDVLRYTKNIQSPPRFQISNTPQRPRVRVETTQELDETAWVNQLYPIMPTKTMSPINSDQTTTRYVSTSRHQESLNTESTQHDYQGDMRVFPDRIPSKAPRVRSPDYIQARHSSPENLGHPNPSSDHLNWRSQVRVAPHKTREPGDARSDESRDLRGSPWNHWVGSTLNQYLDDDIDVIKNVTPFGSQSNSPIRLDHVNWGM